MSCVLLQGKTSGYVFFSSKLILCYSSDPLERGVGGGAHGPGAVPQEVLGALQQEGGGVRTYHTLLQHQGEETGGGPLTIVRITN